MARDVFISYSNADISSAMAVCGALEAAGIGCWVGPRDVEPGASYADAILEAIADARVCVVMLSTAANSSQFVLREVERAVTKGVRILPVRLDGSAPSPALEFFVSSSQYLAAAAPPRSEHLAALVEAVAGMLAHGRGQWRSTSTLPPRNPNFVGRDQVIAAVADALSEGGRVALTGMPGVGKTEVALAYADRHRSRYDTVLWVRADTRDALYNDVAVVARLLRLAGQLEPRQERVVESVREWLSEHAGWLLVLDNADDPDVAAELLAAHGDGHILVTTREAGRSGVADSITVEPLDANDSADLLLNRGRNRAIREEDLSAARAVADRLGGLPLALVQAASFIEHTRSTPREYLQVFEAEAHGLLADAVGHGASVAATFTLAFDQLRKQDEVAADLLCLCAFLAPDLIPEEVLTSGDCCPGEPLGIALQRPLARMKLLRSALRYSLLDRDSQARTLGIHRLVQTVLLAEMQPPVRDAWAKRAGMAVATVFPIPNFGNWPLCERLMPHVLACTDHLARLGIEFVEMGELLNRAGVYLRQRGRQAESKPLQARARVVLERLAPDEMPLAWCLHNLSVLSQDLGDLQAAEPLAQRALSIAERQLSPGDPRLTWFLGALARLAKTQGRYGEAEELLQRSVRIRRTADTDEDAELAWPLQGLGDLYLDMGRPRDAEEVLDEALRLRRAKLEPGHPYLAWTMASLAAALVAQDRYEPAESLFGEALTLAEDKLGAHHGIVAVILERYAALLAVTGRQEQALEMRERSVAIARASRLT
jgi:tetratricopeptide (TPR) repeat protein